MTLPPPIHCWSALNGWSPDCKGIVEKAQAAKDYSAAVRALGEVRQSLELLGQVSGELKRGAGVNVGVAVIPLSEQDRHDLERGRAKSSYEKLTPEEFDAKEAELLAIYSQRKAAESIAACASGAHRWIKDSLETQV